MADHEFGYIEPPEDGPGAANAYMDAETTGRTVNGVPVARSRVSSRLLDEAGLPYSDQNRIPVEIGGAQVTVQAEFASVISVANQPPASIDAGTTWTGTYEDVKDYAAIVGIIVSSGALSLHADFIEDLAQPTPLFVNTQSVPANITGRFIFARSARYFRVRIVNNGATPVTIRGELGYAFNPPANPQIANGGQTTDLNLSGLTQAHLKARIFSGPSAGAWVPLGTDGTGKLLVATDDSAFKRLLKFEPSTGEELRADAVTGGDRFHGAAPDGTAETTASWRVVRFYRDAAGEILRVRYRTGVAWADRATGWT